MAVAHQHEAVQRLEVLIRRFDKRQDRRRGNALGLRECCTRQVRPASEGAAYDDQGKDYEAFRESDSTTVKNVR